MTSNFNLASCFSLVSLCLLNLSLSLLLSLSCLAVSSLLAIPLYHTHAPQQHVLLRAGKLPHVLIKKFSDTRRS